MTPLNSNNIIMYGTIDEISEQQTHFSSFFGNFVFLHYLQSGSFRFLLSHVSIRPLRTQRAGMCEPLTKTVPFWGIMGHESQSGCARVACGSVVT